MKRRLALPIALLALALTSGGALRPATAAGPAAVSIGRGADEVQILWPSGSVRAIVVFVHGCFWHRHPNCQYTTTPKSNAEFWQTKFASNVKRDALVQEKLIAMGWHVLVVWECQTSKGDLDALVATIQGQ